MLTFSPINLTLPEEGNPLCFHFRAILCRSKVILTCTNLYMSSVTSHQACIEIHPPALYKAEHSSGKYSRFTQEITGERPYCGEEGFKIQNQNNYTSFIDVCIVDPSVFR
jgi:hypothetical protein